MTGGKEGRASRSTGIVAFCALMRIPTKDDWELRHYRTGSPTPNTERAEGQKLDPWASGRLT